ncbi:YdeI/OmpD-associated family protein [Thermoflavifilum thermophilum]|uniref:Uncharacterized conserved protein YdeI, YjbR/CyaY-like superfamily, DUF1801 family n=1 Tax=Thermoflavifilum thermophilum TaxID=1393122 RepID=A0A1I7NJL6_9BACT|nr:YdeI/OmpD-associated family protein [Thermoflavifilum thermophilum]SFV34865.1 Uncharacterized conserved protein YdeI, YjbR/CyaY-like superfamily, DUF1801 family [Thermoflavifilum thermophilum]
MPINIELNSIFDQAKAWKKEMQLLRNIVLDFPLQEEKKWGWPCYTYDGKNVVLIHTFKTYCALLFFKGALLKDPYGLLLQQTPHVQAARQMRFRQAAEILRLEPHIRAYIQQAIEVEKLGMQVKRKPAEAYPMPEEFQQKLQENAQLKQAFDKLTPGRRKAYLLYFAAPKQSKTRIARIEKYIPQILQGKGLQD